MTKIQFRTDDEGYRAIMSRKPSNQTLSDWIRQLLLDEPVRRTRVRPRRAVAAPELSEPDRIRALAMTSVLVQLVDVIQRSRRSGPTLSPAMEAELRELLGHVRQEILAL